MRRKITDVLRLAGLREDEIKLYLVCLKMKQASIPQMIAESGLNVMTAYRTVKRLVDHELLLELPLNLKQSIYRVLPVANLAKRIGMEQRKLRKLELVLKDLNQFLPFMDLSEESTEKEPVEVREGLEAFREEYLKFPDLCVNEYVHIGSMQNYWKTAQMTYECAEERHFINRRIARDIHCRVFNIYSKEFETIRSNDSKEKRITRLAEKLPVTENYFGMNETQAVHFICDEENPRAIIIRQPELLQIYKDQFASMWSKGS